MLLRDVKGGGLCHNMADLFVTANQKCTCSIITCLQGERLTDFSIDKLVQSEGVSWWSCINWFCKLQRDSIYLVLILSKDATWNEAGLLFFDWLCFFCKLFDRFSLPRTRARLKSTWVSIPLAAEFFCSPGAAFIVWPFFVWKIIIGFAIAPPMINFTSTWWHLYIQPFFVCQ